MLRPIWCAKCKRHSWTRQQLLSSWMKGRQLVCPEPECGHVAMPDVLEKALEDAGILNLDDDDEEE